MYYECMFCNTPLGENAVLETFPVGRRLAFDSIKGRLWVVCKRCDRWNLTPMEERWEAVEDCERLFGATRLRVSTDNIGMARHAEGIELVRIGSPMRPEFAAWRYGDQFGRRRKRAILYGAAGATVVGAVVVGGALAGIAMGPMMAQSGNLIRMLQYGGRKLRVETSSGEILTIDHTQLAGARVLPAENGWDLTLTKRKGFRGKTVHTFQGSEAQRVAGLLLTRINHSGGSKETVKSAVREIEDLGHPERFLDDAVHRIDGQLAKLPAPTRLALEMALHEERERRALEGELKGLEIIWKREEEIAAISDDLLLPEGASGRLDAMRSGRGPAAPGASPPSDG